MNADRRARLRCRGRAYLADHAGPALLKEIASAVRARPSDVRDALRTDPGVVEVAPPPGAKHNAHAWVLKDEHGVSRDEQEAVDPTDPLPVVSPELRKLLVALVDERIAEWERSR